MSNCTCITHRYKKFAVDKSHLLSLSSKHFPCVLSHSVLTEPQEVTPITLVLQMRKQAQRS